MVKENIDKLLVQIDDKLRNLPKEVKRLIDMVQDANIKLDHVIWRLKENDYSGLRSYYNDKIGPEGEE